MCLKFIHVDEYNCDFIRLTSVQNSIIWINHYFFLPHLFDGYLNCYLLLCLLIHMCKSFPLRFIPWIGFFGHRIFSYSGLLCSSNLFSKGILSSYVSLQWYIKTQGFLSSGRLSRRLSGFQVLPVWRVWNGISLRLYFAFLCLLKRLIIFSYIYLSFPFFSCGKCLLTFFFLLACLYLSHWLTEILFTYSWCYFVCYMHNKYLLQKFGLSVHELILITVLHFNIVEFTGIFLFKKLTYKPFSILMS